jgi:phosphoheptose isomerase
VEEPPFNPRLLRPLVSAWIRDGMRVHRRLLESCLDELTAAAALVREVIGRGGKVLLCGNGGSAGDAQHIAAELVGRYVRERAPLPALALTVDTSVLTALANDYGFAQVFARQVDAHGQPGDALIAISTSGRSPNVIAACVAARARGLRVIGLTGQGGDELARHSDVCVRVPSRITARIQECHIGIGHLLCEAVDALDLQPADADGAAERLHAKHLPLAEAVRLREQYRARQVTVAWTNGCFDVLHAGHARSLADARGKGDLLIVGVNGDQSVRSLKGPGRPVFPVAERVALLGAMEAVDHIVVFDEATPERVLAALRPDVCCKGAEYAPPGGKPMPEAALIESYGGRIEFLPQVAGLSTTATLGRLTALADRPASGPTARTAAEPVSARISAATDARAIFCDRDGTLIPDAGYPSSPDQIELLPGAAAALATLKRRGFLLVVVSNQSGVGRGLISHAQFQAVHQRFAELFLQHGVALDGAYYCLHAPDEDCACRKPKAGLLERAIRELGIDARRSYFVGDKASDMEAGRQVGCTTVHFRGEDAGVTAATAADAAIASWEAAQGVLV